MALGGRIARRLGLIERRWRRLEFWPYHDDQGALIGLLGLVRDPDAPAHASDSEAHRLRGELLAIRQRLHGRYGFDTVISLDLHWLFTSRLMVDSELITGIHSFWFDDLRSHLKTSPMFPLAPLELINGPKVSHHCYGQGQMEELRLLGVQLR